MSFNIENFGVTPLYSRQDLMSNLKNVKDIKKVIITGNGRFLRSHLAIHLAMMGITNLDLIEFYNNEDYLNGEKTIRNLNVLTSTYRERAGNFLHNVKDYIDSRRIRHFNHDRNTIIQKCAESSINSGAVVIPTQEEVKSIIETVNSENCNVQIIHFDSDGEHYCEHREDVLKFDEFMEDERRLHGEGLLVIHCAEDSEITEEHYSVSNTDWLIYQTEDGLMVEANPKAASEYEGNEFKRPETYLTQEVLVGLFCNYLFSENIRETGNKLFKLEMENFYNKFFDTANLITYEEGETVDSGITFDFDNVTCEDEVII